MSFTAPELSRDNLIEANIRLGKIEQEYGVTVVFAVESGSRAWGFPSPDSDNDVRFFYLRHLSEYAGLTDRRDVIERPIDGLWDVNGWDLRKALKQMLNGNATVAEWLSSPLIYRQYGPLPYRLRSLIREYANEKQAARHYYGLAMSCYNRDIVGASKGGTHSVNQKKYLYALRAAMALSWVKKFNSVPPMTMPALMAEDTISWDVRGIVNELLNRKKTMGEFGEGPRIPVIDHFIETMIEWVKSSGMGAEHVSPLFHEAANKLWLDALGIGS